MTVARTDQVVEFELFFHAMLCSAYPAASRLRKEFPPLSAFKLVMIEDQATYDAHREANSISSPHIWAIWHEFLHDPCLDRLMNMYDAVTQGHLIYVGLWVDMNEALTHNP